MAELLKSSDRKKLDQARARGRISRWDHREPNDEYHRRNDAERIEFAEEPMKQARFKEFLNYLKRGLPWQKHPDLSTWEWEAEKKEFEQKLTSEERSMLPEVKSRTEPLAKSSLALPIQELMKSKFVKETGTSSGGTGTKDEDKMLAVKMGMFGERTRTTYEWHPDNLLCRRFNIPNPFYGSYIVGCPDLQKSTKTENLFNLGIAGLSTTENELAMRQEEPTEQQAEIDALMSTLNEPEEKPIEERPPVDIFDAIFGDSESEVEVEEDDEKVPDARENERRPSLSSDDEEEKKPTTSATMQTKVITVMDLVEEEFGPALPPQTEETSGLTGFSVLRYLQDELKHKKKHSHDKKHKSHKKHKKERKSKKAKKEKSKKRKNDQKRSPSSSEDSSSDSDVQALD